MTVPPARRLARYVDPAVDARRIDRVWARVAARRVSSWRMPRLAIPASAAIVALAATALVLVARPRAVTSSATVGGIAVESGPKQTITLEDGSSAVLGRDARLRFDRVDRSGVEATLERGEATFDVRHSEARTWTVHARGFDVVDRGTRFVVSVSDAGVSVRVESGSVEVLRAGASTGGRRLEEGESWSNAPPPPPPMETATAAPPTDVPSGPGTGSTDMPVAPAPPPAAAPPPGPRELLETANAARLGGHPREAARAFDAIRTRFRGDPRAGLAAFELGRLRLDALGDPAGAVAAFDDAIVLSPGASFREDAEARRIEALDRLHDPRCAAARQAFLARYPSGIHAASVSARCP